MFAAVLVLELATACLLRLTVDSGGGDNVGGE